MTSLILPAILLVLFVALGAAAVADQPAAQRRSPPSGDLSGETPMSLSMVAQVPGGAPAPDAEANGQAGKQREEPANRETAESDAQPPLGLCDGS